MNKVGNNIFRAAVCTLAMAFPLAAFAGPVDTDGDGVPDASDNCTAVYNPTTQACDTDADTNGNPCDGDFDQNTFVDGADFYNSDAPQNSFVEAFTIGTGGNVYDMDCDGFMGGGDYFPYFVHQFTKGSPGP